MYRAVLMTWLSSARTTPRAMRLPDACMIMSWKARSCSCVGDVVVDEFVHPVHQGAQPVDGLLVGQAGGDVGHVGLQHPPGDDEVVEDGEAVVLGDGRREDEFVEHVPHRTAG